VTCGGNAKILAQVRRYPLHQSQSVALVGTGIVNVITAYYLQKSGYRIAMFDGGPDTRQQAPWTAFGCTRGGDDARMFTLSEADDYHDKGETPHTEMNRYFRHDIRRSGWIIGSPEAFSSHEKTWIEAYEKTPTWLAQRYNDDIFAFNRDSLPLWERLIREAPALFDDVEYRSGILRLYTDTEHFQQQIARQQRLGALRRILAPAEVEHDYAALAEAVARGELVGGIEVVGFTVNIHKFMARLLDHLERHGAQLHWHSRVTRIRRGRHGAVAGLTIGNAVARADHYVLSLGVYGNELLSGFRSIHKIHGVLGLWLRMPNLEPTLRHSLKIARRGHMAEDANVTVAKDCDGRDILIVGAGYGYVGRTLDNIRADLLDELFAAVQDTARRFFPRAYQAALDSGLIDDRRHYCIRPWTASCLGIFELVATEGNGVAVMTGGHNTGGFAQSPSVAAAVLAALRGQAHPMHEHYHPDRLGAFYDHLYPAYGHATKRSGS
jgi:D-amino-acid dehydrogenase